MKEQSSTKDAPSAPFLSQALTSDGFVFVSGQIHNKPDGTLVEGTTKEKLDQTINNIKTILQSASVQLDDIVKVIIYVTDMSVMPELNEAYTTYFKEPYPVREAVCVKACHSEQALS
ncbi:MAG: Rid family hydrolase [Candidatus Saccharimonadales bacterium]